MVTYPCMQLVATGDDLPRRQDKIHPFFYRRGPIVNVLPKIRAVGNEDGSCDLVPPFAPIHCLRPVFQRGRSWCCVHCMWFFWEWVPDSQWTLHDILWCCFLAFRHESISILPRLRICPPQKIDIPERLESLQYQHAILTHGQESAWPKRCKQKQDQSRSYYIPNIWLITPAVEELLLYYKDLLQQFIPTKYGWTFIQDGAPQL